MRHLVYVSDGPLPDGRALFVRLREREQVTRDPARYRVLELPQYTREWRCQTVARGREVLCDFGPGHDHGH